MASPYLTYTPDPSTTALVLLPIVPSDTVNLPSIIRRLWIGGAGTVTVVDTKDNTVQHLSVPAGVYLGDFNIYKVMATGTTATGIIGYA